MKLQQSDASFRYVDEQRDSSPISLVVMPHQGLMRTWSQGAGWMPLGGHTVLEAVSTRNTPQDIESVKLSFHGGRQQWWVEQERWNSAVRRPGGFEFLSLEKGLAQFEKLTGLRTPTVRLVDLRDGICDYQAGQRPAHRGNPCPLEPGQTYGFYNTRGVLRRFVVAENNPDLIAFLSEDGERDSWEDPRGLIRPEEWINLLRLPEKTRHFDLADLTSDDRHEKEVLRVAKPRP